MIRTYLVLLLCLLCLKAMCQIFPYQVEYSKQPYLELSNLTILCKDSLGKKHFFTLNEPMKILNEEVDSFYIFDWANLHLNLGNKKTKESDLFVPFNTALRKRLSNTDSVGFSISYNITGDIGNRILKVQWKDVKPKYTVAPNDVFNIQMIINEDDQSVSYHFGPMPPEFNSFFSLFGQNRVPALYFFDDFISFSDTVNEIFHITSPIHDINKVELAEFILLDGNFTDEQYSSFIFYNCPSVPIEEGLHFKILPRNLSKVNDIRVDRNKSNINPNPASNSIFLTSDILIDAYYEITNTSGFIEQKGLIENNNINIEQLSTGLHFLKWVTEKGEVRVNKFVKL
ncbi:MAG TPA: T9SS type A sorting domain-containing protein [Saprospiraceae bacterium]|nr:T9SS type A sorting domain-containing protein [Saprospiraceae bacterium]